jgi:hypothetical protein
MHAASCVQKQLSKLYPKMMLDLATDDSMLRSFYLHVPAEGSVTELIMLHNFFSAA